MQRRRYFAVHRRTDQGRRQRRQGCVLLKSISLESVTAISDTEYYLLLWGCSTQITSDLPHSTFFVVVFLVVFFSRALAGPVRPRSSGVPPCSQTTWTVLHLFLLSRFVRRFQSEAGKTEGTNFRDGISDRMSMVGYMRW